MSSGHVLKPRSGSWRISRGSDTASTVTRRSLPVPGTYGSRHGSLGELESLRQGTKLLSTARPKQTAPGCRGAGRCGSLCGRQASRSHGAWRRAGPKGRCAGVFAGGLLSPGARKGRVSCAAVAPAKGRGLVIAIVLPRSSRHAGRSRAGLLHLSAAGGRRPVGRGQRLAPVLELHGEVDAQRAELDRQHVQPERPVVVIQEPAASISSAPGISRVWMRSFIRNSLPAASAVRKTDPTLLVCLQSQ